MDDGVGYYKQCRGLSMGWVESPKQTKRGLRLVSFLLYVIHECGKKVIRPESKAMWG